MPIRQLLRWAFAAALVIWLAPSNASASPIPLGAYGSAVWMYVGTGCPFPTTSPQCAFATSIGLSNASVSDSSLGASTFGQASLGEGFVSVGGTGLGFVPLVGQSSAGSDAVIWDTLVFSGAAPGATGTVTMTGTSGFGGSARVTAGPVVNSLSPGTSESNLVYQSLEGNFESNISTQPTYSVSSPFFIFNGAPALFTFGVTETAGGPGTLQSGNASITDGFSLDLPPGVTFTSASGEFPGSVTPPVPEPPSLMLIGSGLLMVLMIRKRIPRGLSRAT